MLIIAWYCKHYCRNKYILDRNRIGFQQAVVYNSTITCLMVADLMQIAT